MGILDLKNKVIEKEFTEKNDCRFPSEIRTEGNGITFLKFWGMTGGGKTGYQLRFYIQQKYSS